MVDGAGDRRPRKAPTAAPVPPEPVPGDAGAPTLVGLKTRPSLLVAAAAFVGGIILAGILGGLAVVVTGDDDGPALLVAGFIGLWAPLLAGTVFASHGFGTRSLKRDVGLAVERRDIGLGILVGIVGLIAAVVVQSAMSMISGDFVGDNTSFIDDQTTTAVGTAVVVVSTLIGAPIVEEIFFRGLLMHAMARLGIGAVIVQAMIFGMIHLTPEEGMGNVGIIAGLATFAVVLGLAVQRSGRLGPAIVAHLVFNAAAVIPVLVG